MDRSELIHFAMWHTRAEILRHTSRESCILSSKILGDVYANLGIQSMPLTVDVVAFNQVGFEKSLRNEEFNSEDPDEEAWGMRCPVVEGGDVDDQWWKGHLVVLAAGQFICDVSADQFARPEKNIDATPATMEFGSPERLQDWLDGEFNGRASIHIPSERGVLAYEAHPEELSYRHSSDWEDSKPGDGLYDRVMETVIGLCDLYGDFDGLPPLPDLPASYSGKDEMTPGRALQTLHSLKELGYSAEELARREKAEERRRTERAAKRGRGHPRGD